MLISSIEHAWAGASMWFARRLHGTADAPAQAGETAPRLATPIADGSVLYLWQLLRSGLFWHRR